MKLLGILFIFVITALLFGLTVIVNFLRSLLGLGPQKPLRRNGERAANNRSHAAPQPAKRKKVFKKSDGEYVDYEEI